MRSYGSLIRDITEQVMDEYKTAQPFPARKPMQSISLRVILRAVFGLTGGSRYQRLEKLLGMMLDGLSSPLKASLLFFPVLRQDLLDFVGRKRADRCTGRKLGHSSKG